MNEIQPPNTIVVPFVCAVCGLESTLFAARGCPVEWIQRLKKLTACNACNGFALERARIYRTLETLCHALLVLNHKAANSPRDGAKELEESLPSIRETLTTATQQLGAFFAKLCRVRSGDYPWEEVVVENLIKRPDKLNDIVLHYRKIVRDWANERHRAVAQQARSSTGDLGI